MYGFRTKKKILMSHQTPCSHVSCNTIISLVPEYILIFYTNQPPFFENRQSIKKNRFLRSLFRTLGWQEETVSLLFLTPDPCHESTVCASSLGMYLDSYSAIPCITILKGILSKEIYQQYPFLRFSDDRVSFVIEYDQLTKDWQQKKLLMEQMWSSISHARH